MITAKTSASIINFPKNKMKETRYNSSSTKIHTHFYVEYTIFQELHSATEAEESQSSKTFSDLTVISNSSESLNCEPDLLSKLKCSPKSFLSMGIKQLLSALYCRCCHLQWRKKCLFFFCEIGLTFTLLANNPKELCPVPKGTQLNFTSVLLSWSQHQFLHFRTAMYIHSVWTILETSLP